MLLLSLWLVFFDFDVYFFVDDEVNDNDGSIEVDDEGGND